MQAGVSITYFCTDQFSGTAIGGEDGSGAMAIINILGAVPMAVAMAFIWPLSAKFGKRIVDCYERDCPRGFVGGFPPAKEPRDYHREYHSARAHNRNGSEVGERRQKPGSINLFLTLLPLLSAILIVAGNLVAGQLIERTKTKAGKARPWILLSSVLLGAFRPRP